MADHYRRHKDSDTWHFCSNCTRWPLINYLVSYTKPTWGELCNECRAKVAHKNCS
jgi:hypothetical protein